MFENASRSGVLLFALALVGVIFSSLSFAACTDSDGDAIPDPGCYNVICSSGITANCDDNCPAVANPDQNNTDAIVLFTNTYSGGEQDCIESGVCITRDQQGGIYNAQSGYGGSAIALACGKCGSETSQYYSTNNYDRNSL